MSDRGQAYSLEGVIGAIIIASALVLGLQAVSVDPWTGDDPTQGVDTRAQIEDTFDILEDEGALRVAVLCLGEQTGSGGDPTTPHPGVISTDPETSPVGEVLNATASRTSNYNVYVIHNSNDSSNIREESIRQNNAPVTGSATTITREIVIYDSDTVYEFDPGARACVPDSSFDGVADVPSDEIYLEDQDPNSEIFGVVQIRVVAWG